MFSKKTGARCASLAVLMLMVFLFAMPVASFASDGQADLSVSVADSRDPVDMSDPTDGNNFTYAVVVTNNDADDTATGVTLTDTVGDKPGEALPWPANITPSQGADIYNFTTTQGTCAEDPPVKLPDVNRTYGQRLVCDLGSLAPGASATVTIYVGANLNTFVVLQPEGIIVNIAQVSATTSDPQSANNTDVETTTVTRPTL
ncbi:MAG: hypothetical protein ACRDIU_00170 [Actinomycetota bacterium]